MSKHVLEYHSASISLTSSLSTSANKRSHRNDAFEYNSLLSEFATASFNCCCSTEYISQLS